MKEFADDNFKFDENGRKYSKRVENTVGRGEIAHNEQYLLFLQCFLLNHVIVSPFIHIFYIIPLFAAELEEPEIGIEIKG